MNIIEAIKATTQSLKFWVKVGNFYFHLLDGQQVGPSEELYYRIHFCDEDVLLNGGFYRYIVVGDIQELVDMIGTDFEVYRVSYFEDGSKQLNKTVLH